MPPLSALQLGEKIFTSFDFERFGYLRWMPENRDPRVVIIGVHGISGAAVDFETLGLHLESSNSPVALMAYELRGQGNDPLRERRGDITHPSEWFNDLYTFTALVRREFPEARIVWFGESMGSLITLNAYPKTSGSQPPCDALILSSPVVSLGDNLPGWKKAAVHIIARAVPWMRVSLERLSGETAVRVTHDTIHQDQAASTPWHVRFHTFRLLATLGKLIETMPAAARSVNVPTLILHGGHDYFSTPPQIDAFTAHFRKSMLLHRIFYPESYHLLMYDQHRDKVIRDITAWVENLPLADVPR